METHQIHPELLKLSPTREFICFSRSFSFRRASRGYVTGATLPKTGTKD